MIFKKININTAELLSFTKKHKKTLIISSTIFLIASTIIGASFNANSQAESLIRKNFLENTKIFSSYENVSCSLVFKDECFIEKPKMTNGIQASNLRIKGIENLNQMIQSKQQEGKYSFIVEFEDLRNSKGESIIAGEFENKKAMENAFGKKYFEILQNNAPQLIVHLVADIQKEKSNLQLNAAVMIHKFPMKTNIELESEINGNFATFIKMLDSRLWYLNTAGILTFKKATFNVEQEDGFLGTFLFNNYEYETKLSNLNTSEDWKNFHTINFGQISHDKNILEKNTKLSKEEYLSIFKNGLNLGGQIRESFLSNNPFPVFINEKNIDLLVNKFFANSSNLRISIENKNRLTLINLIQNLQLIASGQISSEKINNIFGLNIQ